MHQISVTENASQNTNPNYLPKITGDICFVLTCQSFTDCIKNKKTIIVFTRTTRRIVCYSHNIKTETHRF